MTAAEAKANQERIVAKGYDLGWWYGTRCRKCCGVYPAFRRGDGQDPCDCWYECEVCGRKTGKHTMPWLAEEEWNSMDWLPIGEQMRLEL